MKRTDHPTLQQYFDDHPTWTAGTCMGAALRLQKFLSFARIYPVDTRLDRILRGRTSSVRLGLPPSIIERVFDHIPERQARDALLYRLLYFGCLRVGEVTALRVEDVDIRSPSLCCIRVFTQSRIRKGEDQLRIDDPALIERLRDYQNARDTPGELFFQASKSDKSRPLRQQNLHRRWQAYASKAGVSCSLEDVRVSGLLRLAQDSGDLRLLHFRAGYKKLETTRRLVTLANHLGLKHRGVESPAPVPRVPPSAP